MTVKHGILGLLALKPRYGYELRAAFLAVVGGKQNWDIKPAQIYSTLARLEKAGLLSRPEAGLLEKELALLTGRVQAMRPTEMRMATCYEPMAFTPGSYSAARIGLDSFFFRSSRGSMPSFSAQRG